MVMLPQSGQGNGSSSSLRMTTQSHRSGRATASSAESCSTSVILASAIFNVGTFLRIVNGALRRVTPELSEWLGGLQTISRPQLTSKFWAYVKGIDALYVYLHVRPNRNVSCRKHCTDKHTTHSIAVMLCREPLTGPNQCEVRPGR